MLDPALVSQVELSAEDFYLEKYGRIYRAIVQTHADSGCTDPISVAAHLPPDAGIDQLELLDLLGAPPATGSSAPKRWRP